MLSEQFFVPGIGIFVVSDLTSLKTMLGASGEDLREKNCEHRRQYSIVLVLLM